MPEPGVTPSDIGPTANGLALRIVWEDGHTSVYPPLHLRLLCPCAGCVDEMTGQRVLTAAMVDAGVYPLEIRYVGRYALQFVWSDGHDTGFYAFDYLRGIDPGEPD